MDGLEELWGDVLSGDEERIQHAWSALTGEERQALRDHLTRMRDGDGWHPAQRQSAAAALAVIRRLAE